jgi:tRNA threonylcarbamoyladenosine biosynthesis protein TsaE
MRVVPHVVPSLAGKGGLSLTREELIAWGERFGHAVQAPLVVALSGPLGAGKTTLAQAICHGYGVTERVTSPTFAIVQEYDSSPRSRVYHLDLYRVERPADLTVRGWDEIVTAHALVLIEWPEHAGDRLPADNVPIALTQSPGVDDRRVLLAG